jgi:double-strand break repair protein MRE11
MNFHVMQPGSSVATSLMPGEAVPKHVAILSITGRDFKVETIRLKTVRPFVMKEIVLSEQKDIKKLAKVVDNRSKITQHLIAIVDELIEQAKVDWIEAQDATDHDEELEVPLPLIRLRVEYSAPDGGNFDCENPQRFSNRFVGRVANVNDVVQFYRKKAGATKKTQSGADLPEESILAQMDIDSIKVEKLVREFLSAQSLTILPQNSFGDAVSQFVDKDDKHAMEIFVNASLSNQIKHLMDVDQYDDDDIQNAMDQCKSKLEELFAAGHLRKAKKAKLKPKPDNWDTDLDGEWGDQPGALIHSDVEDGEDVDDGESVTSTVTAAKGRGKPAAKKATAPAKKAAPAKSGRGRKKVVEEDSEEGDEDVVMVDEDEEDEEELFVKPAAPASRARKPAASKAAPKAVPKAAAAATTKRAPARAAAAKSQSTLNFSQSQPASQASGRGAARGIAVQEVGGDEISDDDDDAFAPPPTARSVRSKR